MTRPHPSRLAATLALTLSDRAISRGDFERAERLAELACDRSLVAAEAERWAFLTTATDDCVSINRRTAT